MQLLLFDAKVRVIVRACELHDNDVIENYARTFYVSTILNNYYCVHTIVCFLALYLYVYIGIIHATRKRYRLNGDGTAGVMKFWGLGTPSSQYNYDIVDPSIKKWGPVVARA